MAAIKFWFDKVKSERYNNVYQPASLGDLTEAARDALFDHQLRNDDFGRLNTDSLMVSRITHMRHHARSVLRTCHKIGVINRETGHPDTSKIDKNLVNRIAILGPYKCHELVHLLFFWEEELVRWRLLSDDETDLRKRLDQDASLSERVHIEESLKIIEAKKRVLPSLRDDSGQVTAQDELPGYEQSNRTQRRASRQQ